MLMLVCGGADTHTPLCSTSFNAAVRIASTLSYNKISYRNSAFDTSYTSLLMTIGVGLGTSRLGLWMSQAAITTVTTIGDQCVFTIELWVDSIVRETWEDGVMYSIQYYSVQPQFLPLFLLINDMPDTVHRCTRTPL